MGPHSRVLAPAGLFLLVSGGTAAAFPPHEGEGESGAAPTPAVDEYSDLQEALRGGRVWLNFNYRYEHVEDDRFTRNANANTLRTVLGYETGSFHGLKLLLEFEDVSPITDGYNSTTNGKVGYPVVADPDSTEVNQGYFEFGGIDESTLRLGRQQIILDNARFVGNVVWRQNHQTYDAFSWTNTSLENTTLFFAYVDQVNRVFGEESPVGDIRTDTLLLNAGYDVEGWGKATGYWYELDNEDQVALSSSTFGFRFAGAHPLGEAVGAVYAAEYANQTDTGKNPNNLDQDYYLAELGATYEGWELLAALEHLGGSGNAGDAFQTPLATLFKFNGYADQFLTTPPNGLEDYYVVLTGNVEKVGCYAAYHMFESDSGSFDYGTEIDLRITYPLAPDLVAGLQWASFDGDQGGFVDVTKFWFFLTYAAL